MPKAVICDYLLGQIGRSQIFSGKLFFAKIGGKEKGG
jgi:hypothetical protein